MREGNQEVRPHSGGGNSRGERGPRVNHEIRVPEVRLVSDDGEQFGVVRIEEARRIADEKGVDLVEIASTAKPPVVKLVDYGKYKYELQKKAHDAKKKQVAIQLKEIQFRPNIDKHDLEVKVKKVDEFLKEGDKVRMVMQFRGREIAYKDAGLEKFKVIIEGLLQSQVATVESDPKFMGNRILAILAPTRKK